ncbi:MAG: rhodanese-like domain-containing protein, partial [Aigarchaeota archaeon]|nr:rhodanese-like domain-containing protein [Aigarchaeota archaeon]
VGLAAGLVARPALMPVEPVTKTVVQERPVTEFRTFTVERVVTVTVEQKVDTFKILHQAVDKVATQIPVGRWWFIDAKDLKEKLDAGERIVVVDVRERAEWDAGRIPGAIHIRLSEVPKHIDKIPKETTVVVYCKVGIRSAMAMIMLRVLGYENVLNLRGGFDDWAARGYPVEK